MNRNGRTERAQTAIDFAIAMGVFLVALTTVVAFMPSMIQPFTGSQENPLVADRAAAQLTGGQLTEPSRPSVLNTTCTMYFFNNSDAPPGEPCDSFDNPASVTEKLGVSDRRFVNVSLRQNVSGSPDPDVVCAFPDGRIEDPATSCAPGDANYMAIGPAPPTSSGSVTTARRVGTYDDEVVYVVVKVWT